jgi:hypothetical protein
MLSENMLCPWNQHHLEKHTSSIFFTEHSSIILDWSKYSVTASVMNSIS